MDKRMLIRAAGAALALALLAPAQAQVAAYPDHPIRIVVPYPPGGFNDTLARTVGAKLQSAWGQPVDELRDVETPAELEPFVQAVAEAVAEAEIAAPVETDLAGVVAPGAGKECAVGLAAHGAVAVQHLARRRGQRVAHGAALAAAVDRLEGHGWFLPAAMLARRRVHANRGGRWMPRPISRSSAMPSSTRRPSS